MTETDTTRKTAFNTAYARDMRQREAAFDPTRLTELCINVWDDYDEEHDETFAYVEEDTPDAFDRQCLEHLIGHLQAHPELLGPEVSYRLHFHDSVDDYPQWIDTELEGFLYRRWEIRFQHLRHASLNALLSDLEDSDLAFSGVPLTFISES